MGTRIDRTIVKIEGMIDAVNECGRDDYIEFDTEEGEIMRCVLEEALKALREKQESV